MVLLMVVVIAEKIHLFLVVEIQLLQLVVVVVVMEKLQDKLH